MASCLFRVLARPQVLKFASLRAVSINSLNIQHRNIHITRTFCQKYFTEKHEWVDVPEGSNVGTVGITDYAQDKLGDVVYVQLPDVGQELEVDGEAGVLESVKAASDIYSPVTGEVTEINEVLNDTPKKINESPYDEGWLYKLTLADPQELEPLMSEEGYNEYLTTIE
ncbi:hypothetical protein ACF0H5_006876 [Mactra antiquata]